MRIVVLLRPEFGKMRDMKAKLLCCAVAAWFLAGCATSRAPAGAVIGAGTGAALGLGLGYLISDEDLLGSPAKPETGDTSLPPGGSMLAGLAIGAVVGGIVGAMVGHQQDQPYGEAPAATPSDADAPVPGVELEAEAEVGQLPPRAF